ncbi:MAG: hypothetical protein E7524_05645 [Ruminococcaceae bacterium]|nr:hypothetical protein [Oscillospiraceae bacterium]
MKELYSATLFSELYDRIVFRSRQLYKSKNSNSITYLSHPTERSLIIIKKRKNEVANDLENEIEEIQETVQDDDCFNEYDKYADDDIEEIKEEPVEEIPQKKNTIYSKLLKMSMDGQKTWLPFDVDLAVQNINDKEIFVSDIYNSYFMKLNIGNLAELCFKVNETEEECEYILDDDLINEYYIEPEENYLTGIKLEVDSNGNIISKQPIRLDSKDFYGTKFTEVFPPEKDNVGASETNPRTLQHLKYLEEHADELNIQLFGKVFTAKGNETAISNFSSISLLSNEILNESPVDLWKEDIEKKLNINPKETPLDEYLKVIENCFGIYFPLLMNDLRYSLSIYKNTISDIQLLDTVRAMEKGFNDFYKNSKGEDFLYPYAIQLPFVQYSSYINDLPSYIEEYQQYQENTNNYSGSFIGGGFGAKGAIKGMLTASIANLGEELIHNAVEYNSMEHKYVGKAIEEFGITENSRKYILKLIELEKKFTLLIIPYFIYEKMNEFFGINEDNSAVGKYANDYLMAVKYYAVYLANKYSLSYKPEFLDENNRKLKFISQKELLEKAICTFPYECEFYSAYIDECAGEKLPLGFAKLMRMFDIQDERFSDVETKEKEEYQRLENERLAREAWEAAEKARQEEERRQREAEQQKKYDELAEIYGNTYHSHEMVFKSMLSNDIFVILFKRAFSSTDELIADVDKYLVDKSIITAKLFTKTSPKFNTMLQKAKASYVQEQIQDTDVLLMVDATIFGNAKNGFILTKNAIYLKGMLTDATKINFSDIEFISAGIEGLSVAKLDYSLNITLPGSIGEIGKIVACVIANQMYINENGEE